MTSHRTGGLVPAAALALVIAAPALAAAACAPAATGIFPASGIQGTSIVATISGTGLDGGTLTVLGEPGLTATVQSSTDIALAAHLDLDAAAAPGERIVVVETAGGSAAVSFTINAAGGPIVDAASPPLVATLGMPLAVTITGTGLGALATAGIAVSGQGVTVAAAVPNAEGTSLALDLAIDAGAGLGTHALTLTAPGGSAVLQLYVQRPAPTITSVTPAAIEVGATAPITISGTNLTGAALVITGSGVTPSGVTTPDDATLTATVAVDGGVTPSAEPRLLIVTTESGQTTAELFVVAAGVPTVTGIAPGAGEPGTTVAVTLRGLHLTGGSVTVPAGDLTLQNPVVVDDRTITLDVQIAGGATPNVDHTLTVTVGSDTSTATFRVIAASAPFIGAVRPPFGNRGATITIRLDGVNLGTVVAGTGVQLSGPKITESNATALDARTVQATIEIDPTASVGTRDVTVTTSAGSYTRTASFRVNVPGQVPSITDVTPTLVDPGTTTPMTVTGSNFLGGSALVTGPGATLDDPSVDGTGTSMTFDLSLASDAPAENRAVVVVTENGTARCNIASDPAPPVLVAAKLVKTGATFTASTTGLRLFVFEFSASELFPGGGGTWTIADADGTLVLDRQDAFAIEHLLRERHRGFVRLRAVTPTNRIGVSTPQAFRR